MDVVIIINLCFRQNGADASSEDFESSSSILESERPQARHSRRSRSYSRSRTRGRASDSSPTRKKTTFLTDNVQTPGVRDNAIIEEDNVNGGSIKSSSSYDASKISFQGKRALFESRPIPMTKSASKSQENLVNPTLTTESPLVAANRRLEDEVARLEQVLVLREEASRKLREGLETQLGTREGELQRDLRRLVRDNTTKEEIIK